MYFTINTDGGKAITVQSPSLDLPGFRAEIGGGNLPAATYYYVLTALNANGETLKSNEVSVTSGLNSANVLTWSAVTNATGYKIYRGTVAGSQNVYYTLGAVTNYTDTGTLATTGSPPSTNTTSLPAPTQNAASTSATGGTLAAATYYYVVSALNANGETLKSNEVSIATVGSTSSNTVNWNAVTNATGYKIYKGTAPGSQNVFYTVGNVTSYLDTGSVGSTGTPATTNTTGIIAPIANTPITWQGQSVGYITADGEQLIMMEVLKKSIITLAPYPPNVTILT